VTLIKLIGSFRKIVSGQKYGVTLVVISAIKHIFSMEQLKIVVGLEVDT